MLLTTNASAYRLCVDNQRLDKSNMLTYYVHQNFSDTTFAHMNHALYKWYQATGYNMMQRHPTERHSRSDFPTKSDGLSLVYRIPVGINGYVAINRKYYYKSDGIIFESDINFNMSHKFANSAQPGAFDTYSIFLHETGHTVGLGDIDNPSSWESDSVMLGSWDSSRMNTISYRNLRDDDIQGAKIRYS